MVKKRISKQNVIIIILSVLLLVSVGFGATYAYFSGSSKQLTSGYITTAVLHVNLSAIPDEDHQSDTFQLVAEPNNDDKLRDKVVPGQSLTNTALEIQNTSPVETYMMVVYKLAILGKVPNAPDQTIPDASKIKALELTKDAVGDGWRMITHTCRDGSSLINALVYLGDNGTGNGVFTPKESIDECKSLVLNADCLRVPSNWGNEMQGTKIQVTFTGYVLQSTGLDLNYKNELEVINGPDAQARAEAIAKIMINEFYDIDTTVAPSE